MVPLLIVRKPSGSIPTWPTPTVAGLPSILPGLIPSWLLLILTRLSGLIRPTLRHIGRAASFTEQWGYETQAAADWAKAEELGPEPE